MTISTQNCTITLQGNGVATSFNYNFIIPFQADGVTPAVNVYTIDPTGVQTLLAPTAYAITGIGVSSGGTVNFTPIGGVPLPTGWELVIDRNLFYTQPIAVVNQGFSPHTVEVSADLEEMQIQQLLRDLQRLSVNASANTYLGLTDVLPHAVVPKTYVGRAGQLAIVNSTSDGMDFANPGAGQAVDEKGEVLGGVLTSNEAIWINPITRPETFPANLFGSVAYVGVAPTANTTITFLKNGVACATLVLHTDRSYIFTTTGGAAVNVVAGDILTATAPATPDATAALVAWAWKGTLT